MFAADKVAVAAGAHDALTARLAEDEDFDVVWGSSFGISLANYCLPDLDLLTMTETVDALGRIAAATSLPVLADGNAGYGGVLNIMRLVQQCELVGVSGICIEDNPFPKRSSLYAWERQLVDPPTMMARIRSAVDARSNDDFCVVARIESLIAGESVATALQRGRLYDEAGADAIMVHGKQAEAVRDFASRWDGTVALIAAPTLYHEVTVAELASWGIRLVIFPNHALRSAIRSMRRILRAIRRSGASNEIEDQIEPLDELAELVGLEDARLYEERFTSAPPSTSSGSDKERVADDERK